jgi:hypothetical protein
VSIDYNIPFGGSQNADANTWGGQAITIEGNSSAADGAGGGVLTVTGSVSPTSITITGGDLIVNGGFVSTGSITLNNATLDMSLAGGVSGTTINFGTGVSDVNLPHSTGSGNFNGLSFTNFGLGDSIQLDDPGNVTNLSYDSGTDTLSFDQNGFHYAISMTLDPSNPPEFHAVGNEIFDGNVVCYAAGTRIRTTRGEIAVEALRIGDEALTISGEARPIVWLGRRTWRRTNAPRWRWPVRIAAGAFGPGKPSRDLIVSPGHGICVSVVDEVFMPVDALVNGATIARIEMDEIEYWHVELESHDVLIAEGLPAESYFDCGNRAWFSGGSGAADNDGITRHLSDAARPYLASGPVVEAVRVRLRALAETMGWRETSDMDLHLLIDGKRTEPSLQRNRACFVVPAAARDVVLAARTFFPSDTGAKDHRELGVSLSSLHVRDGFGLDSAIALDHPSIAKAFHPEEGRDGSSSRWTGPCLPLPNELWSGSRGPVLLTLVFNPAASRRWIGPESEIVPEQTNVVPIRAVH